MFFCRQKLKLPTLYILVRYSAMSHIEIYVGDAGKLRKLVDDRRLAVNVPIPDDRCEEDTKHLSYLRIIGNRAYVHKRIMKSKNF